MDEPPRLQVFHLEDITVHADEAHGRFLVERGLTSSRMLLDLSEGTVVDRNTDKWVVRLDGPVSVLYLKRFREERLTHVAKRIFGQRLCSLGRIEAESASWLRRRAFRTADVLFWGHTTFAGLDGAFSFVALRALEGFQSIQDDPSGEALRAAARVLARMVEAGFYWPDSKPKHFLCSPGAAECAVIDLHGARGGMRLGGRPIRKMVGRFLDPGAFRDPGVLETARRSLVEAAEAEISLPARRQLCISHAERCKVCSFS